MEASSSGSVAVEVGWLTAQYLLSQLPVLQGGLCGVAWVLLGLVDGVGAENLTYSHPMY